MPGPSHLYLKRTPLAPSRRGRAALLVGTALTTACAASITAHVDSALAACAGENTANVSCDAANQATAGALATTFAGSTTVNDNPGGKIDSGGASATVTAAGTLTFNNNDTTFGIKNNAGNGVTLTNNFGGISYTGGAAVTATGGDGIGASTTGAGNVSVTNGNAVTGAKNGIAVTHAGTGAIFVNNNASVSGGNTGPAGNGTAAISVLHTGLGPPAGSDGIVIAGSGATTGILLLSHAIDARISNSANASNILINQTGTISGASGIVASTNGTGSITVTGAAASITGTNGPGIQVEQTNNAVGTVGNITIGGSGDVTTHGLPDGVSARITGANNAGNIVVNHSGNITSQFTSLQVNTAGSGDVTITGIGDLHSTQGRGIEASSAFGDVVVTPNGTVAAPDAGIIATAGGNGTVTVNSAHFISGGAGEAIKTSTVNGLNTVNVTGGSMIGLSGIVATSTGTGSVVVNMTGGRVDQAFTGITATSAGGGVSVTSTSITNSQTAIVATITGPSAGNVAITANGPIETENGGGIFARIVHSASTGAITVTQNGAITTNGTSGIMATNAGSGAVTINANAVITGTAGAMAVNAIDASATTGNINVSVAAGVPVNGRNTGVKLTGGTTNAITNNGAISAALGVQTSGGATTITNSGSITGTGGTAVQLGGANNLFVMNGPSAALAGNAIGSGSDTFRLAGSGANTFDVSQIGTGWTAFEKTGSLTWTVTGNATYAGPAAVNAGTLLVNGSLASSSGLTVASGGIIGGTGTLPSTVINGGTLSPGNSIGTITISGNLTFVGAGNYIVEVSPTAGDRTNVSGTAALAGNLQLVATGGSYALGKQYVLLDAAGGISGHFTTNDTTGMFGPNLKATVSYTDHQVLLTLDPTQLVLSAGLTRNQNAVGSAVNAAIQAGNTSPLVLALLSLPSSQFAGAFNALSGEVHASTAGVLADESHYVRGTILGRLRQATYGDTGMAALSLGGPQNASLDEGQTALAYAKSPLPVKARPKPAAAGSDIVFWADGFGAWGRFDSDGNAAAVRRDLAGFISGVDAGFGDWRGGVAAGYTSSRNTTDGRGAANVETGHVAAYGGGRIGGFNLRGGGAAAWHTIDTDRTIAFSGLADRAVAHYDGRTGQVFGELGYGFGWRSVAVEPFAGAAWVRVSTDAATERALTAGLNVSARTVDVGYSTLGLRAASIIPIGDGMVLIPRASAAWQHAFDDVTPATALAFQATGTSFVVGGIPLAQDSLLADAGVDLAIGRNATVGISYVGQIAHNVQDHAAKGRFSWKF